MCHQESDVFFGLQMRYLHPKYGKFDGGNDDKTSFSLGYPTFGQTLILEGSIRFCNPFCHGSCVFPSNLIDVE